MNYTQFYWVPTYNSYCGIKYYVSTTFLYSVSLCSKLVEMVVTSFKMVCTFGALHCIVCNREVDAALIS